MASVVAGKPGASGANGTYLDASASSAILGDPSKEPRIGDDPFTASTPPQQNSHHSQRFSCFDTELFALNSSSSPSQVKRALEAHLAETERRIGEASRLGTTLVRQRKDLSDRLKEVEAHQGESDLGPELRQRMIELEKEYIEVGKESARATLGPRSRVTSTDVPAAGDRTGVQRPASPSTFMTQGSQSPSKLSVPSRLQRNMPSGRVHDIDFVTEISASLLNQVRDLQMVIANRDQSLRTAQAEKAKLEADAEGFAQRLRNLDESEQKYKDENWNLETQIQDLIAAAKDATDREQRLTQSQNSSNSEKNRMQRELDELKQLNAKYTEEHATRLKQHEIELSVFRRAQVLGESERGALQRKIEELHSQNQELARAVAFRGRSPERMPSTADFNEDGDVSINQATPENSPPGSPTKGTPRHGMLESETLKSSLSHAHGMIQNLKRSIHREKTEKLELKRMLQDARDELEQRRNEGFGGTPTSVGKRRKPNIEKDVFKKPAKPALLGAKMNSKSEILIDDDNWEDHAGDDSPTYPVTILNGNGTNPRVKEVRTDTSDAFETANEASDVFETADERHATATETEAFQTGAESLNGDSSGDLTETEGQSSRGNYRHSKRPAPLPLGKSSNHDSYMSTASTSGDEDNSAPKTPVPQHQRLRLKVNRGAAYRRSKIASEIFGSSNPPSVKDSPASFISNGTPQHVANDQSLFAELGDLGRDESDDDVMEGTPSRSAVPSQHSTPANIAASSLNSSFSNPRTILGNNVMVDSAMMTEPWEPSALKGGHATNAALAIGAGSLVAGGLLAASGHKQDTPITRAQPRATVVAGPHDTQMAANHSLGEYPETGLDKEMLAFPLPPSANSPKNRKTITSLERALCEEELLRPTPSAPFSISSIHSQQFEPSEQLQRTPLKSLTGPTEDIPNEVSITQPVPIAPSPLVFAFSSLQTQNTEPIAPVAIENSTLDAEPPAQNTGASGALLKNKDIPSSTPIAAAQGTLGSMLGWKKQGTLSTPQIAEDDASREIVEPAQPVQTDAKVPFQTISNNIVQRDAESKENSFVPSKVPTIEHTDHSSQTLLSWDQIESLLKHKHNSIVVPPSSVTPRIVPPTSPKRQLMGQYPEAHAPPISPKRQLMGQYPEVPAPLSPKKQPLSQLPEGALLPPNLRRGRSQESMGSFGRARAKLSEPNAYPENNVPLKSSKRPGSISSIRSSHPPLPPNHQEAIAAAAQRVSSSEPGLMGPPMTPASAYRASSSFTNRPLTPASQQRVSLSSRAGTTPRARPTGPSRRSSVSSFASELDQRFNIRAGGPMVPGAFGEGTDPRMILAITQTMIGEYMWKYTRKAGRGTMSDTRHRRYFWVHPYTRTLYWSDGDPQHPDRAELKAKSVAIDAVRVITDDNPMPPGLHRKSIVILTPGRTLKFTATTGQRHETWFNALSYLLLRTGPQGVIGEDNYSGTPITADDINDFHPGYGGARHSRASRSSLASYNSRIGRINSPRTASIMSSTRHPPNRVPSTQSIRQRSISRLSNYFKPGSAPPRGSFSSKRSRQSQSVGIYEASEVHDSAEDLREVIERQDRDADELENVRACCDGKHDVGSLAKRGKHSSISSRHSHSYNQQPSPKAPSS